MCIDRQNPTGDYYKNRDFLIQQEKDMFARCAGDRGVYLNLGCGSRLLQNFINVDRYHDAPGVLRNDITELPNIVNGSADLIFSAHSLEHVRHRLTVKTLRRWSDVLRIGGELWLSMPDLDLCCQALLANKHDYNLRKWLKRTIYGYQAPMGLPDDTEIDDPGQYHLAGYSADEMEIMLINVGIEIHWKYVYDGYGSPSFFILGLKHGISGN